MKTRMQQVLANATDEQARLVWSLLASFVEDSEVNQDDGPEAAEVIAGRALRSALDTAMASYADDGEAPCCAACGEPVRVDRDETVGHVDPARDPACGLGPYVLLTRSERARLYPEVAQ